MDTFSTLLPDINTSSRDLESIFSITIQPRKAALDICPPINEESSPGLPPIQCIIAWPWIHEHREFDSLLCGVFQLTTCFQGIPIHPLGSLVSLFSTYSSLLRSHDCCTQRRRSGRNNSSPIDEVPALPGPARFCQPAFSPFHNVYICASIVNACASCGAARTPHTFRSPLRLIFRYYSYVFPILGYIENMVVGIAGVIGRLCNGFHTVLAVAHVQGRATTANHHKHRSSSL